REDLELAQGIDVGARSPALRGEDLQIPAVPQSRQCVARAPPWMVSPYGGPDAGELLKQIDPTVEICDTDDDVIDAQLVRTPGVFTADGQRRRAKQTCQRQADSSHRLCS